MTSPDPPDAAAAAESAGRGEHPPADEEERASLSVRFSLPPMAQDRPLARDGSVDTVTTKASEEGSVVGQGGGGGEGGGTDLEPSLEHRRSQMRRAANHKRRQSSLELRKNAPDADLLNASVSPHLKASASDDVGSGSGSGSGWLPRGGGGWRGGFRNLFLNPSYPLRRQMLLSFGCVSFVTIALVVVVTVAASIATGDAILDESDDHIEMWMEDVVRITPRYVSEAVSPKIMPTQLVDLLVEIGRDRFFGYPTAEDDSSTPFFDTLRAMNVYPLKNNPLPMDWDFRHTPGGRGNVDSENYAEHVQDRLQWYTANPRLSTMAAFYNMQGACDPNATMGAMGYYPSCTDANNDVETGGVIAPTPTNAQVYRKASDLSPFLKALYEYHYIKQMGYYFANGGAGSTTFYPHYELDSTGTYVSIGCEWMRTPNPINASLGPIGTEEMISRCHPEGTVVPTREYNPLERAWCRDQALNPQRVQNIGPYLDAWAAADDKLWFFTVGRAHYDDITGAFVFCIAVDFSLDKINQVLDEVKLDNLGILTLVRNNEAGAIATSSMFDLGSANATPTVEDLELETGFDRDMFDQIKTIVDYSQPWEPEEASRLYESALFETEDHIISSYPLPPVPDEYDPAYEPTFFVVFSWPKAVGLTSLVETVEQEVEKSVGEIILFAVLVGLGGVALVTLLIFVTSSWFVEPLRWMNSVGDQVVGNFGEDLDEDLDSTIDFDRKKAHRCSPTTELTLLAAEFSRMVTRFSREGAPATRCRNDDNSEKMNVFDFSDEFRRLYDSREGAFAFNYSKPSSVNTQCNMGPNIRPSKVGLKASSSFSDPKYGGKVHQSHIFRWMVALIVTPILLTTVALSAVVLWRVSHLLPYLLEPVREEYLAIKNNYRFAATGMLASSASAVSEKAARDTYLLARFASWLLFGGMKLSGSFTEVIEGAEECKHTPPGSTCDWTKVVACDCRWNDFNARGKSGACTEYPSLRESRADQKAYFESLSQDTNVDGSRYETKLPFAATSPNLTAWWDNITVLPRTSGDFSSSNYDTTHKRVQIISALSSVFMPLYNYDKSNGKTVGLYVAFEADGMLAGYTGCNSGFAMYPFWNSTEDNGAAKLRPELCPLGKYGYDARCRGWYDEGRRKEAAGKGNLHVTAPYVFASDGSMLGQSTTSPLVDPKNSAHIGQVLVDYMPDSMYKSIRGDKTKLAEGGFPILITPESDVLGHDTVVGPGFSLGGDGKSMEEILRPDDAFKPILRDMKAGKSGNGVFSQRTGTGEQILHISYAPVRVRYFHPLDSSDIASGVKDDSMLVYSLALIETQNGMTQFQSINSFASRTVSICIGILAALIAVSTILIVLIATHVTKSMTKPILKLFEMMKDINRLNISNEDINHLSDHKGSCREVDNVYQTMEMLFKVIHFANYAFFSGNLELAYKVFGDALRLFTRLDNKKAVAVASNNLGNTMLSMYRTMKEDGREEMCGLSKEEVVKKGTAYFTHSIKLGEEAYDRFYNEQGWSEECLAFMQFLANRYFNRAVLLLTTSHDSESQKEAESLGFRDLQIVGDMDVEIVDQCLEMGFKINRFERFELMMSRVRGLNSLVGIGYSPDEVFVEDQITEVYETLKEALKDSSHGLFKEISAAGRMQKLDVELIKFFRQSKDIANAARVAIRMLIEDEYILNIAQQEAINMLLIYMNTTDDENRPEDEDGTISKELGLLVKSLENDFVKRVSNHNSAGSTGMRSMHSNLISEIDQTQASEKSEAPELTKMTTERRVSAVKQSCRGDTTMEQF